MKKFLIQFFLNYNQLVRNINYLAGFLFSILFFFVFNYSVRESIAIGIFFYWVISLINNSSNYFPIMQLFFCLFSLQFLFGPALSYNGFDEYTIASYRMKISSESYFDFVIPLFISFPLGFKVYFRPKMFVFNQYKINVWLQNNNLIPYYFIIIGLLAPFITSFIPSSLAFVGYLLESFKFIGLFILILSSQKIKPMLLIFIYGGVLISSFTGGMFHDLLIWLIVLGLILIYKFKPAFVVKIIGILIFTFFASFIQSIKGGLRSATWEGGNESVSFSLIESINKENVAENSGFFSINNLGPQINRINQGWILASAIDNVPSNEQHTYGQLTLTYLYSAFMPRIFAPDKLKAGDQAIFNKYSGHNISDFTAMGLGLFTDAYVEFGYFLAIFYVFSFGVLYGFILNKFMEYSSEFPIIILFSVLAFVYPMRPDCETQTVLGHLFKTIMLLLLIFNFFKTTFKINEQSK